MRVFEHGLPVTLFFCSHCGRVLCGGLCPIFVCPNVTAMCYIWLRLQSFEFSSLRLWSPLEDILRQLGLQGLSHILKQTPFQNTAFQYKTPSVDMKGGFKIFVACFLAEGHVFSQLRCMAVCNVFQWWPSFNAKSSVLERVPSKIHNILISCSLKSKPVDCWLTMAVMKMDISLYGSSYYHFLVKRTALVMKNKETSMHRLWLQIDLCVYRDTYTHIHPNCPLSSHQFETGKVFHKEIDVAFCFCCHFTIHLNAW